MVQKSKTENKENIPKNIVFLDISIIHEIRSWICFVSTILDRLFDFNWHYYYQGICELYLLRSVKLYNNDFSSITSWMSFDLKTLLSFC